MAAADLNNSFSGDLLIPTQISFLEQLLIRIKSLPFKYLIAIAWELWGK